MCPFSFRTAFFTFLFHIMLKEDSAIPVCPERKLTSGSRCVCEAVGGAAPNASLGAGHGGSGWQSVRPRVLRQTARTRGGRQEAVPGVGDRKRRPRAFFSTPCLITSSASFQRVGYFSLGGGCLSCFNHSVRSMFFRFLHASFSPFRCPGWVSLSPDSGDTVLGVNEQNATLSLLRGVGGQPVPPRGSRAG